MKSYAWGKKRVCAGCAVHYYDLKKPTPACPKCGMVVDFSSSERSSKRRVVSSVSSPDIETADELDFDVDEGGIVQDVDSVEDGDFDEDLPVLSTDDAEEL
ncbi:MAG: FYDLN acid domain-containing protein [Holosporales bacterium]|nr:FYDLN acid domain-containing protein [Holosporales bacterium]